MGISTRHFAEFLPTVAPPAGNAMPMAMFYFTILIAVLVL